MLLYPPLTIQYSDPQIDCGTVSNTFLVGIYFSIYFGVYIIEIEVYWYPIAYMFILNSIYSII